MTIASSSQINYDKLINLVRLRVVLQDSEVFVSVAPEFWGFKMLERSTCGTIVMSCVCVCVSCMYDVEPHRPAGHWRHSVSISWVMLDNEVYKRIRFSKPGKHTRWITMYFPWIVTFICNFLDFQCSLSCQGTRTAVARKPGVSIHCYLSGGNSHGWQGADLRTIEGLKSHQILCYVNAFQCPKSPRRP